MSVIRTDIVVVIVSSEADEAEPYVMYFTDLYDCGRDYLNIEISAHLWRSW